MFFSQLSRGGAPAPPGPLAGKKLWLPPMSDAPARALAAVFRSLGVDAECTPRSDARTRELGARHTNGDECYPTKVTMGDYLKVLERPGTDPRKTAFLMATGQGPCRFGQYLPYLRSVLETLGYRDVTLLSPSFENGYSDLGENSTHFVRSGWRAIVASDILRKLLLKARPYGAIPGAADAVHEECVRDLCRVLECNHGSYGAQMERLRECLLRAHGLFRMLPRRNGYVRPLIGIVGEIFCRLNTFSNEDLVRRLEEAGAEVWMNDISEWIWYTNSEASRMFRLQGSRYSKTALASRIRAYVQKKDEHDLVSLFRDEFRGYEEPEDIQELLDYAEPYLPAMSTSGEMVVNIGKTVYFARKGLDGVIDISPFTCMNGIVCEAIYPRVSRDNAGIPIRNFYFDGTQSDLDRDIGIYLELARSYQQRKPWPRVHSSAA